MLTPLFLFSFFILADDPNPKTLPATKTIFADEAFYKDQKAKETDYLGVLRYKPLPAGVGIIGRYNPFTLEMTVKGKKEIREVYIGGKDTLLKPYAGVTVKILGKPVEIEVVGKVHKEIWPAKVEVAKSKDGAVSAEPSETGKVVKVVALSKTWSLFAAGMKGPFTKVISDSTELAVSMGKGIGKEEEALQQAARAFKVKSIDFKKQKILLISAGTKRSGGYSVEVNKVELIAGKMKVNWILNTPKPGGIVTLALTNPGLAILVERMADKVEFNPALNGVKK